MTMCDSLAVQPKQMAGPLGLFGVVWFFASQPAGPGYANGWPFGPKHYASVKNRPNGPVVYIAPSAGRGRGFANLIRGPKVRPFASRCGRIFQIISRRCDKFSHTAVAREPSPRFLGRALFSARLFAANLMATAKPAMIKRRDRNGPFSHSHLPLQIKAQR